MKHDGKVNCKSSDVQVWWWKVREIPLFQGNLGWWNIIIWPDGLCWEFVGWLFARVGCVFGIHKDRFCLHCVERWKDEGDLPEIIVSSFSPICYSKQVWMYIPSLKLASSPWKEVVYSTIQLPFLFEVKFYVLQFYHGKIPLKRQNLLDKQKSNQTNKSIWKTSCRVSINFTPKTSRSCLK